FPRRAASAPPPRHGAPRRRACGGRHGGTRRGTHPIFVLGDADAGSRTLGRSRRCRRGGRAPVDRHRQAREARERAQASSNRNSTRAFIVSQTTVSNPTRVDEIADGIYRLATAIDLPDGPGAFSFNQYLIDDDEPLLFHTGPRKLFPLVRQGVEEIMPLSRLRYVAFSHFEADECGALNDFLAAS